MVVLATSIVLVAVLAWVSRRLLGLPVGALRAAIAGLVGFVAALIVGQALRATESGHLAAFFSVALGVPLIVAMIFIVAAEALVPTGAGPQPVEIVRAHGARSRARGATRRSAGSWCGTGWVPTCRGGRCAAGRRLRGGR